MSNQLQTQKVSFSMAINAPNLKQAINNTLKDPKRVQRFTSSIISAVSNNKDLQECEASTIVTGALLGESLNLSPSPQLGQYYLVPFKKKPKYKDGKQVEPETTVAQFLLGYKGYIQLAIRSGYYKKLNVMAIKEGELIRFNPIDEEIEVNLIEDEEQRENTKTVGYYAMFEYQNGFRKAIYWSRQKMLAHADKYSAAFSKEAFENIEQGKIPEKEMWRYSSFWYKDFDGMAYKTMLRQLISKWGVMSIEMQDIYQKDMGVINDDGTIDYVENDDSVIIQQDEPTEEAEPVSLDEI